MPCKIAAKPLGELAEFPTSNVSSIKINQNHGIGSNSLQKEEIGLYLRLITEPLITIALLDQKRTESNSRVEYADCAELRHKESHRYDRRNRFDYNEGAFCRSFARSSMTEVTKWYVTYLLL
jgi:hypothetical protein